MKRDYCGRRGNKEKPLAPEPTKAIPGTEGKIRVMRWRARHGFAIFHPDDYVEPRRH